jgi:hypothetical protein
VSDWKSGVGKNANVLVLIPNFCGRSLKGAPPQIADLVESGCVSNDVVLKV